MNTTTISRRKFAAQIAGGFLTLTFAPTLFTYNRIDEDEISWYNVQDWGVEGKGWTDTKRYFDRLPSRAEGVVRKAVWDLSRHSAGMRVRFISEAQQIHVRYKLLLDRLALPHMPATGVSGLDLYAEDAQGIERWVSVVKPTETEIKTSIAEKLIPGRRMYTLYLPLYNGVESLEIGVSKESVFESVAPRSEKPILFYGTSIMHGACASRPGMSISSILGRRLRRPTINLAFSGNGRMEAEVGALLAEQDPCVFAIDCLPNMNEEMINERAVPLVKQIRNAHPKTPILLVEDRSFSNTPFFPDRKKRHETNRVALRKAFRQLQEAGVEGLYYLDGENLLGLDGEAATDGSHPSDLGMVRYADAYEPALRAILKQY